MEIHYDPIKPEQTHVLRQKILRPHQPIEEMVYPLDSEAGSFHVGALLGDCLVGIASVYPESQAGELNQGEWRIRGMAVEEELQGRGVGRGLVQKCIEYAQAQKAQSLWCNARTSAIGFYFTLRFEQVGEEFNIAGIGPHYVAELSFKASDIPSCKK